LAQQTTGKGKMPDFTAIVTPIQSRTCVTSAPYHYHFAMILHDHSGRRTALMVRLGFSRRKKKHTLETLLETFFFFFSQPVQRPLSKKP
jgi:hypothetical protein